MGGISPARWQQAAMQLSCGDPEWPSSRSAISVIIGEDLVELAEENELVGEADPLIVGRALTD
jgi:hypothetical protein